MKREPDAPPLDEPSLAQPSTRERLLNILWLMRLSLYAPALTFFASLALGLSLTAIGLIELITATLLIVALGSERGRGLLAPLRQRPSARLLDRFAGVTLSLLLSTELALTLAAQLFPSPLLQKSGQGAAQEVASHKLPTARLYFGKPINDRGYFDDPIPTSRDPRRRRVVAIGDSFAVGIVPHHQNFLTLLECPPTNERQGIEVINLGVCAIGPFEYRWLWDNEARALEPEVLILSVFIGNDLFISIRDSSRFEREGWYCWLVAKRLLSLSQHSAESPQDSGQQPLEASIRRFSPEAYLQLVQAKSIVFRRSLKERHERRIQAALEAIDGVLHAATCPVIMVLVPDELQVNRSLQSELFASPEFSAADFDLEGPNRRLAALAAAHPRLRLVDPLQALRAADLEAPTYEPRDTHWNARGNAIVATQIAPVLAELLKSKHAEHQ